MRRTWAYNGIVIGFLIGFWVWAVTQSTGLAVVAGIVVSAVAFLVIRFLENLIYAGAEKAGEKIREAYEKRKEPLQTSDLPSRQCKACGAKIEAGRVTCKECGSVQNEPIRKCKTCGAVMEPGCISCKQCGTIQ